METGRRSKRRRKQPSPNRLKENDFFSDGTDLEPLTAASFERRLNSLSQAMNAIEDFHRAFVSQHPEYG